MRVTRAEYDKKAAEFKEAHARGLTNKELAEELDIKIDTVWRYIRNLKLKTNKPPAWFTGWESHIAEMYSDGVAVQDIADTFEAPNRWAVTKYITENSLKRNPVPMELTVSIEDLRTAGGEIQEPHYIRRNKGEGLVVMSYDHYMGLMSNR